MSRPSILYVEDDDAAFYLVRTALDEAGGGIILIRAEDGEEALSMLTGYPSGPSLAPDLILLDLNLPKKTGIEILALIKNDPVLTRIPVVVFTTSRSERDQRECLNLGAHAYFVKPSAFEAFLETLSQVRLLAESGVQAQSPKAQSASSR